MAVRRLLDGTGGRLLLVPPAVLFALGLLLPLCAIIIVAVQENGPAGAVAEPLSSALFLRSLGRTLLMSVEVTAIAWVVGLIYSLALGLASPFVSKLLFGVLFLTFWISLLVRTYGWVLMLQPAGALDAFGKALGLTDEGFGLYQTGPGLLPPMVHIMLPYMVLPIFASLQGIDGAQLRAARSLGGSEWLVLRKVVLPSLRSGSVAGAILVFILSLGFYVTPAFLGGPGQQVVAIVIGLQFGRLQDVAVASSMGAILLIVVLGLYFAADRIFRISEKWERL